MMSWYIDKAGLKNTAARLMMICGAGMATSGSFAADDPNRHVGIDAKSGETLVYRQVIDFQDGQIPSSLLRESGTDNDSIWQIESNGDEHFLAMKYCSSYATAKLTWPDNFAKGRVYFETYFNTPFELSYSSLTFSREHNKYANTSTLARPEGRWHKIRYFIDQDTRKISWDYRRFASQCGFFGSKDTIYWDNLVFIADGYDGDQDGLADTWEYENQLDFTDPDDAAADTDNDGLSNLQEYAAKTDPNNADTDGDGLTDGVEVNDDNTEVLVSDTDGDGILDGWEVQNGLDPRQSNSGLDTDGDGFGDLVEFQANSDPKDPAVMPVTVKRWTEDFEDEPMTEGLRVAAHSEATWQRREDTSRSGQYSLRTDDFDPVKGRAWLQLSRYFAEGTLIFSHKRSGPFGLCPILFVDGQQYSLEAPDQDWQQAQVTLSEGYHDIQWLCAVEAYSIERYWLDDIAFFATGLDSDGDGITDKEEWLIGLDIDDPNDTTRDSDGDGLTDYEEASGSTDRLVADTDSDGLPDGQEVKVLGTQATTWDTDQDGLPDGWEVKYGLSPLVANGNQDSDGDGLTNYEELLRYTNPLDAQDKQAEAEYVDHSFESSEYPVNWIKRDADHVGWVIAEQDSLNGQKVLTNSPLKIGQTAKIEFTAKLARGSLFVDYKVKISKQLGAASDTYSVSTDSTTESKQERDGWTREEFWSSGLGTRTATFSVTKGTSNTEDSQLYIDNVIFITWIADNDGDGMTDRWEHKYFLDMRDPSDALEDPDNDGLTNWHEYKLRGHPNVPHDPDRDFDGDGVSDIDEIKNGSDPVTFGSIPPSLEGWLPLLLLEEEKDKVKKDDP